MKKNILKKSIALTLSLAMITGLCACGNDEAEKNISVKGDTASVMDYEKPKAEVKYTDFDFIKDGKSEYKILVPAKPTENEQFAADELQYFVKEATGCKLEIVKEGSKTPSAYISVGATKASDKAGIKPDYTELKTNGYILKTVEQNCYITGSKDYGTRNGIYGFLERAFDYEYYAEDCINLKESQNEKLADFDIKDIPDYEWRTANNGELIFDATKTYRMRMNQTEEIYVLGHLCHCSFTLVSPNTYDYKSKEYKDWFSETINAKSGLPSQLCYSNEDMQEVFIKNLVDTVVKSDCPVMLMGMEDNVEWCTCKKCTASKEKYGTNSAVVVKVINKAQKAVNDWFKKNKPGEEPTRLIMFAYYETEKPPVKYNEETKTYEAIDDSVKLNETSGIMYAPINAIYSKKFEDDVNASVQSNIEGWAALTDKIHIWIYSLLTSNGLLLNDTFEVLPDNYRYLLSNNAVSIIDQTDSYQENCNTGWARAQQYVQSKVQWDTTLNMEDLLKDFFKNYFGEAADTMYKLFIEQREWFTNIYNNLGASGKISDDLVDVSYWKYAQLKAYLAKIDKAYEDIASLKATDEKKYEQIYDRIALESMQFRYIMLMLYPNEYDEQELQTMKTAFKMDFERFGLISYAEGCDMSDIWSKWGIN